jgi:excisionase family DNA binding protein
MAKKKVELQVVSPFLDVTEAAMYIKVAKGTLYQLIHKREESKIPVRYNGRKPFFFIEELKEWMLQRSQIA